MKRLFDIILSVVALIICSPLLIPLSIILLLTGEHYIFYTHKRVGRYGKEFDLIKFSTMLKNSPNIGTGDVTVNRDPRVLPVGHFLRTTKINELPQLLNILIGDMSFVGPRPLTPRVFNYYTEDAKNFVIKMKPGLTGVGSIIFRDEESVIGQSKLPWEECIKQEIMPRKAEAEKWYFQHQGLLNDILLMFITGWVVLFPKSNLMHRIFKDLPELNCDHPVVD
jgi:lipopolysaccharide/colanic/teichoic acid biosynthesis glycosyltransferase